MSILDKVEYAVLEVGTHGSMWVASIGSDKTYKVLSNLTLAEAQECIKIARTEKPEGKFRLAKRVIPWWTPLNENK